ncbi:unnamed protein product [Darwinula stevensoni]|uniref:Uncharacterized protein n=1 Tax=Darwinula stevensoni TaxID=69355 RepID=A0A7R9AF00_9CRUS|nr:unnamed protein product [Darwinula stevensoni]CAG0902126.1 unnamed protein product [Darwinula stevensoni]
MNQGLRLYLAPNPDSFPSVGGYRVYIRQPQDTELPVDEGYDVNLGMLSNFGLKTVELDRIPPEDGGNCAPDSYLLNRFDPNIFSVTNETAYSKEECQNFCVPAQMLQDYAVSCLSIDKDISLLLNTDNPALAMECNGTLDNFDSDREKKENDADHSCGCPPQSCTERTIEKSYSTTKMGSDDSLLVDLVAWVRNELKNTKESELRNRTYCRRPNEQAAVVHVFYETISIEKTTETRLYPWSSFIGTLGGLLGLYTGMSFVSVLEMFEWIFDIALYGWKKPRHDKMGPKRRAIIAWKNEDFEASGENHPRGVQAWKDIPVYDSPPLKDTRGSAFDLLFSDHLK